MERESKTDAHVYAILKDYFLMQSRTLNRLPNEEERKNALKIFLGKDIDKHKINLRQLETDVVKQRVDEILKQEKDVSQEKLEGLIGVNISRYLNGLGFKSFSDLRSSLVKEEKKKIVKEKVIESDKNTYTDFRDYYLNYLRENNEFPKFVKAKKELKIPSTRILSDLGINLPQLKTEVLSKRIEEIYSEGSDPTRDELDSKLGVSIRDWIKPLGFSTFSDMRSHYTGKENRGRKPRTFKTNKEAQNKVFNYYLDYSRKNNDFPERENVESDLKIHLSTYGIDVKDVKVKVIKKRLEEDVYGKNLDPSLRELDRMFGVGFWRYVEDLGFKSIPDMREFYVGKNSRRKFATKKEALKALRKEVKELILKKEYKNADDAQKRVGTNVETYGVNWKKDVLYPVYDDLIKEEFRKNPQIGDEGIKEVFSFSQAFSEFLKNQGGILKYKERNKIPIIEVERTDKFTGLVKEDKDVEEKEKMLITYSNLIQELVKSDKTTTEGEMWNYIKEKTGKSPNSFDVSAAKEYLRRKKVIEGNIAVGYRKIG